MNTAEAMAATLYIVGFKEEAVNVMSLFGYGQEFLCVTVQHPPTYELPRIRVCHDSPRRRSQGGMCVAKDALQQRLAPLAEQRPSMFWAFVFVFIVLMLFLLVVFSLCAPPFE